MLAVKAELGALDRAKVLLLALDLAHQTGAEVECAELDALCEGASGADWQALRERRAEMLRAD